MHIVGALMLSLPFILWAVYGIRTIGWKFVLGFLVAIAVLVAWIGVAMHLLQGR